MAYVCLIGLEECVSETGVKYTKPIFSALSLVLAFGTVSGDELASDFTVKYGTIARMEINLEEFVSARTEKETIDMFARIDWKKFAVLEEILFVRESAFLIDFLPKMLFIKKITFSDCDLNRISLSRLDCRTVRSIVVRYYGKDAADKFCHSFFDDLPLSIREIYLCFHSFEKKEADFIFAKSFHNLPPTLTHFCLDIRATKTENIELRDKIIELTTFGPCFKELSINGTKYRIKKN